MLDEHNQPIYFISIALPEPLNTHVSRLMWQLYDDNNPHMLKPLLPHVTLLHPPVLHGTLPEELIPRVREGAHLLQAYPAANISAGRDIIICLFAEGNSGI
jgi:2'-5' RNA ligase